MRAVVKQGASVRMSACRCPNRDRERSSSGSRWRAVPHRRFRRSRKAASADPVILGHEFAGVVAADRRGDHEFAAGDRVVVMPAVPC